MKRGSRCSKLKEQKRKCSECTKWTRKLADGRDAIVTGTYEDVKNMMTSGKTAFSDQYWKGCEKLGRRTLHEEKSLCNKRSMIS